MSPAVPHDPIAERGERLKALLPMLEWSHPDGEWEGWRGDDHVVSFTDGRYVGAWTAEQSKSFTKAIIDNEFATDEEAFAALTKWRDATYPQQEPSLTIEDKFSRWIHEFSELLPGWDFEWKGLRECEIRREGLFQSYSINDDGSVRYSEIENGKAIPRRTFEEAQFLRSMYLLNYGPDEMKNSLNRSGIGEKHCNDGATQILYENRSVVFDPAVGWLHEGERVTFEHAKNLLLYPEPFAAFLQEVRKHQERTGIKAEAPGKLYSIFKNCVALCAGSDRVFVAYSDRSFSVVPEGAHTEFVDRTPEDAYVLASTILMKAAAERQGKVSNQEVTVPIKVDLSEEDVTRAERMADSLVTAASAAEALNTQKERAMQLDNRAHIISLNRAKQMQAVTSQPKKEDAKVTKRSMTEKAMDAAYLTAAEKLTKTGQVALVNALMRQLGSEDEGVRTKLAAFFTTDLGSGFVAGSIGYALQVAPHSDERIDCLADSLQTLGMAKGMGALADVVLDPILAAAGDAIKGLPEPEKVRAVTEATQAEEHEAAHAKGGKQARR